MAEAGGSRHLFGQEVQDQKRGENRMQRVVQISLRVVDRDGIWDTEGEGEGPRKNLNGGTGIYKT